MYGPKRLRPKNAYVTSINIIITRRYEYERNCVLIYRIWRLLTSVSHVFFFSSVSCSYTESTFIYIKFRFFIIFKKLYLFLFIFFLRDEILKHARAIRALYRKTRQICVRFQWILLFASSGPQQQHIAACRRPFMILTIIKMYTKIVFIGILFLIFFFLPPRAFI